MELGLAGKTSIVTGAGRGIGRVIAHSLAREGSQVVIADIDWEGARAVATEIDGNGGRAVPMKVAVNDADDVSAMAERTLQLFGRVDVLVNNAAINSKVSTRDLTLDRWLETLDVNLTGVFNCCKAVMGSMMEQRSGRIVSIGSINGSSPWFSDAAYVATKAGLLGLNRKIAHELGPYGVTCNVVAPSMVLGPMSQKSLERLGFGGATARFPLGRLCEAQDVANAVVFLASEAASFITGQVIHVNGGAYMG